MFSFAIFDRKNRCLFLARDRFGVKPLYWYCKNGVFIFGSEIKAILEHPEVSTKVCYAALNEYFTFQNIFTDLTLFDGIQLLPAGCMLTLALSETGEPRIERYWDYSFASERQDTPAEKNAD